MLSLGDVLYHKKIGEVVVCEIIGNNYFAAVPVEKIDEIKEDGTEEFFYKVGGVYKKTSIGKWLFRDENHTESTETIENTIDKKFKININPVRNFRAAINLLRVENNYAARIGTIGGDLEEILNRIALYRA